MNTQTARFVSALQILARRVADEASFLAPAEAERHIAAKVTAFREGLAVIDEPFATVAASCLIEVIHGVREKPLH